MVRRHRIATGARLATVRLAAVGLAVATVVAGVGIALGAPARAADDAGNPVPAVAPAPGTTATVTAGDRTLTLSATPSSGLAPSGARLTVTGSGFDTSHDLWVAVCEDDGAAPAAMVHCVGGAIPEDNATTGWGVVTSDKHPPYAGPVTTSWKKDGSFKLTLQLPSAMSEDADCVSASCSVYTRSSDNRDRSQDARVPVSFAAPPEESASGSAPGSSQTASSVSSASEGSSSQPSSEASSESSTSTSATTTTSLEPTTTTIGVVPTTVSPEIMLRTSATVGSEQTVLFAGFMPGEKVDVTLYSKPVKLPAVKADPSGNVRISFTVPRKLSPGEHLLQAIGRKSGRVGIAQFAVGAAPSSTVSASASETTSASASASASVSAGESAAASSAGSGPAESTVTTPASSTQASSAAGSLLVTASGPATSSSVAPGATGSVGNRLLWLWIVLAVLVVVGGAAAVIVMVRNRRDREDDLPRATQTLPPAPGWSAGGAAVPPGPVTGQPGGPPTAPSPGGIDPGGFGLLSGRDHPDGPVLYSGGQWPDPPTSVIGDQQRGQGPAAPGGPATEQWRPDFTAPAPTGETPETPAAPGGPATEQWRPDFTAPTPEGSPDTPTAPQPETPGDTPTEPPGDVPPSDASSESSPDTPEDDGSSGGRHRTD